MQETWVRSLGREDPLKNEMATHSSILAWRIPWTEEPGGLQSTGSQRVGHDWVTSLSLSERVSWSLSRDLKEVVYIWEERDASRRERGDSWSVRLKRKMLLEADPARPQRFFAFYYKWDEKTSQGLNRGVTYSDLESLSLLPWEYNTGDKLMFKKIVNMKLSFNWVSCFFFFAKSANYS